MVEHTIVRVKSKRKKIIATCENMGQKGWTFAGMFHDRFLIFFARTYMIFTKAKG